jgi:hypothetical protein
MTTRRKSPKKTESFVAGVTRGMRRAARSAREVARMHGTPIYVWEDGKVVAKKTIECFRLPVGLRPIGAIYFGQM